MLNNRFIKILFVTLFFSADSFSWVKTMRFHYLRMLKSNELVAPAPAQIDFYYEWVKNIKGVERKLEGTNVL